MSDYEEQWEVYPSRIDDEFAMFAVNLGPHDDAPFDNLRWLNIVRLSYDARPGGMPDEDTNQLLYEIEDLICQKSSLRGGILVGRLTVAGRRELFLYSATDDTELMKRDLNDEFGDLDIDTIAQRDADWEVYFEFLYPQPLDFQRISNQRVVKALAEHGDIASIPRKIDHHAFFPDEATRRDFARSVAEKGFEIEEEVEADDGDLRFALTFSSVSTVDLGSIDQLTIPLFVQISEAGGSYDGWGCEVQTVES